MRPQQFMRSSLTGEISALYSCADCGRRALASFPRVASVVVPARCVSCERTKRALASVLGCYSASDFVREVPDAR